MTRVETGISGTKRGRTLEAHQKPSQHGRSDRGTNSRIRCSKFQSTLATLAANPGHEWTRMGRTACRFPFLGRSAIPRSHPVQRKGQEREPRGMATVLPAVSRCPGSRSHLVRRNRSQGSTSPCPPQFCRKSGNQAPELLPEVSRREWATPPSGVVSRSRPAEELPANVARMGN